MSQQKILIIDDEKSIRKTLSEILCYEGYLCKEAEDGESGLNVFSEDNFNLVLCDIKMPKLDGLEFLNKATELKPDVPIVMISGHATIDIAIEAVKNGAFDFLQKPPDLNKLLITVRNALDKQYLVEETKELKIKVKQQQSKEPDIETKIIGNSEPILQMLKTIDRVAPTDARVLILGANGTGKELVAKRLHEKSLRNKKNWVEVNCAAIPSELIESELFGHEKGSFTSAIRQRIGKFEQADGGTLFLDEIGDMSLSAQAKVLRALQEGKITRVGGEKEIAVNVRVIAATNKDLKQEIAQKNFREDLYHRLGVIVINVPKLNERRDDIPLLINHFLQVIAKDYNQEPKKIDEDALAFLKEKDWTGNIRELRNVVERLVILSDDAITINDVKLNS